MKTKEEILIKYITDECTDDDSIIKAMEEWGKICYNQAIDDISKLGEYHNEWYNMVNKDSILKLKKE